MTTTVAPPTIAAEATGEMARPRGLRSVLIGPRRSPPADPRAQATRLALLLVAGLSAWALLFAGLFSGFQEARSQSTLYATLRERLALETVPLSGAKPGDPIAVMDVPALGVHKLVVVQGTTAAQLRSGPGHRRDTVLPGQVGTSVVYGRSLMFGGPFRDVPSLRPGDAISVTDPAGTFAFHVLDVRRAGDPYPAPLAAGSARLVLVTSEGTGWRSGWSPYRPVYVDADLYSGTAQPATAVESVSNDEAAMTGQSTALTPLVLWLQGLLLAAVAVAYARGRFGVRRTWVVGVPVLLALLWGVSQSAALLLPNLI